MMKTKQIIRPSTHATEMKYNPQEIHTFFKSRGTNAWDSKYKS